MIQDMLRRGLTHEVIDVDAELAKGEASRLNLTLMAELGMLGGKMIHLPVSAGGDDIVSMRLYFRKENAQKPVNMQALGIFLNNIASAVENMSIHEQVVEARDNAFKLNMAVDHHVRNSLSPIGGFSKRLAEKHPEEQSAAIVYEEALKLERKIKRFDLIGRFLSGKPPEYVMGEVDAGAVLTDVAKEFTQVAIEKGLGFDVRVQENLPKVRSNESALRIVLGELVDNAVVHTNAGGVRLSASEEAGRTRIQISVSDSGEGFSQKTRQDLFKPFNSSDPQRVGGGLFIARSVTQLIGGELRVKTTEKGTTVSVLVPKSE